MGISERWTIYEPEGNDALPQVVRGHNQGPAPFMRAIEVVPAQPRGAVDARTITRVECSNCGQEWHTMDCGGCGHQTQVEYVQADAR